MYSQRPLNATQPDGDGSTPLLSFAQNDGKAALYCSQDSWYFAFFGIEGGGMSGQSGQDVGALRMVQNVLLEPASAFAHLRERPSWLPPLILIAGGNALAVLWYFSILDYPWFMEGLLYAGGADPSPEQIAQFNEQMESVSPTVFMISGFLGASLGLILIWILQAAYLTLVSALTGDGLRFGNWFCLVAWTAIPALFSIIGSAITLLLNPDGQISQTEIDPLLLGNLGLQFGDSPFNGVANTVSLTYLWSLALLVYGYRQWAGGSWLRAAPIVLLPQALLLAAAVGLASMGPEFNVSFIDAEGGGDGGISISLSL